MESRDSGSGLIGLAWRFFGPAWCIGCRIPVMLGVLAASGCLTCCSSLRGESASQNNIGAEGGRESRSLLPRALGIETPSDAEYARYALAGDVLLLVPASAGNAVKVAVVRGDGTVRFEGVGTSSVLGLHGHEIAMLLQHDAPAGSWIGEIADVLILERADSIVVPSDSSSMSQ